MGEAMTLKYCERSSADAKTATLEVVVWRLPFLQQPWKYLTDITDNADRLRQWTPPKARFLHNPMLWRSSLSHQIV